MSSSNGALRRLAGERESREGRRSTAPPGKPVPWHVHGPARSDRDRRPTESATFFTALNAVSQSLGDFGRGLAPARLREARNTLQGVVRKVLAAPADSKFRVVRKAVILKKLEDCRGVVTFLEAVGFRTVSGADGDGRQIDWLVLDHKCESDSSPSDLQKLERARADLAAALKAAPTQERPSEKAARERQRELVKFHEDRAEKKQRRG